MGDTLAGMINSFVGQGYKTIEAVLLAVYLHGYCGDIIAEKSYRIRKATLCNGSIYS